MECGIEAPSEQISFFEGWVKEGTLGKGTFGCVTLWKHQLTHEAIAIKECCVQLSPKNKQRWREEIEMMTKKRHPNLISVREIPAGLESALNSPEPCLGMEQGEGGDLRKFLNLAVNCAGLNEFAVLNVLRDVANAVSFLHSHRIIHRDLKPENILLTYMGDKVIYKITDLGYAKHLDKNSVANSFVGTMKYLAPELYTSNDYGYTITADFWSLGNVMFECITGHRPFDLDNQQSFVSWHAIVSKKNSDHICGYKEEGKEIEFCSKLQKPNKLSSPLVPMFEEWLRLVLEWNPMLRGGGKEADGRRRCFGIIDEILNTKVVHLFCVNSCKLISFDIEQVATVRDLLENVRDIYDVEPDTLVLPNGETPDNEGSLLQCYNQAGDSEWLIYAINVESLSRRRSKMSQGGYNVADDMAPCVRKMVEAPEVSKGVAELKRIWAYSVDFCSRLAKNYRRLLQAQRAVMISLRNCNSGLLHEKEAMACEAHKLSANLEMFIESCEYDLQLFHQTGYDENPVNEQYSDEVMKMIEEAKLYKEDLIDELSLQVTKAQKELVSLKNSSLVANTETELDKRTQMAKDQFDKLGKFEETQKSNSKYMAQVILEVLANWERLESGFYSHLGKVMNCKRTIEKLLPDITKVIEKLKEYRKKLQKMMKRKQELTWKTLTLGPAASVSLSSGYNSMANTLTSLIENVPQQSGNLDSLSVVKENEDHLDRLGNLIRSLSDQKYSKSKVSRRVSADAALTTLREDGIDDLNIRKRRTVSEPL